MSRHDRFRSPLSGYALRANPTYTSREKDFSGRESGHGWEPSRRDKIYGETIDKLTGQRPVS
jgi:hypothetical protein